MRGRCIVTSQNESLAAARDITSAAAEAYRTLGLDAAKIEALPIEERMIAVARAFDAATDKTAAFHAAAQILGSRGLPQLLNALRGIGTEGVANLQAFYEKQGLIMGEETIAGLDGAQKAWANLWHRIVVGSAEAGFAIKDFVQSLDKAPKRPTLGWPFETDASKKSGGESNAPGTLAGGPSVDTALRNFFGPLDEKSAANARDAEARAAKASVDAAAAASEAAERRVNDALDAARRAEAERIASINREGEAIRQSLLTPAEEYAEEMARIKKLFDSGGFNGTIRERAEAAAAKRRDDKINASVNDELSRFFGPLDQQSEENNRRDEIGNDAGMGVVAGMQDFLLRLGNTGQQVASTLSGTLGQALGSLSHDLFAAVKGTQSWGQAWKNLGAIALQMLSEMIIKMILFKTISMVLGAIGFPIPSLAMAGGGTFVTSGPTKLTVGDNPGGMELVNVIPLSGVGRSTINGQALHMAGGGSALVGGSMMRAGGGSGPVGGPVTVQFNFATGLSSAIRAEVMAMAPDLRSLAVDAVRDAQSRNYLRFT